MVRGTRFDLQGCVADSEPLCQLPPCVVQESIVKARSRAHEMGGESRFLGAHRPPPALDHEGRTVAASAEDRVLPRYGLAAGGLSSEWVE